MKKEGVNVGEFQIKLLKKIEELTLYSIEQNKKLAEQNKLNDDQTKKLLIFKEENKEMQKALKDLSGLRRKIGELRKGRSDR